MCWVFLSTYPCFKFREGKLELDEFDIPALRGETNQKFEGRFYTNPMEEYFDDGHHTETTVL